jgi:Right handed beta helix region
MSFTSSPTGVAVGQWGEFSTGFELPKVRHETLPWGEPMKTHVYVRLALASTLILSAIYVTNAASPAAMAATSIVDDGFNRTVDDWGAAPTGGLYSYIGNDTTAAFSTDGARGTIRAPSSGAYREADLTSVSSRDTDAKVKFRVSALPSGGQLSVGVVGRASSDGVRYVGTVNISSNGSMTYGVTKWYMSGGNLVSTNVGSWRTASGLVANVDWTIRLDIHELTVERTQLRMKLWKSSTTEPSSWAYSSEHQQLSLFDGGYPGLRVASGSGMTNQPDVSFDDLHLDDIQPPRLSDAQVSGGSTSWQSVSSITISACCVVVPPGSPAFDHYEYQVLVDGAWSEPPSVGSSVTVTAEGSTLVRFRAVDVNGTASFWAPLGPPSTNVVRIDRSGPTPPTVYGGSATWLNVQSRNVEACCSTDAFSRVQGYEFRTSTDGGSSWGSPTAGSSVTITAVGETLVQFRAVDVAGNASAWAPSSPTSGSTVRIDPNAPAEVGTVAPTHIRANTTWTAANDPYFLGSNPASLNYVYVDPGVTLTIQPGVEVRGVGLNSRLIVNGSLSAGGTSENPILFTSSAAPGCTGGQRGSWYGIKIAGPGSTLDWTRVCYGGYTSTNGIYAAVQVQSVPVTISHSDILRSGNSGITLLQGAVGTITDTEVRSNWRQGVYVYQSSATIQGGSSIHDNRQDGVYFLLSSTTNPPLSSIAQSTIVDSDIFHNGFADNGLPLIPPQHGVNLSMQNVPSDKWPTGTGNNIVDNGGADSGDGEPAYQIYVGGPNASADWSGNYLGDFPWAMPCFWAAGAYQNYNMTNGLAFGINFVRDLVWAEMMRQASIFGEFPIDVPWPTPAGPIQEDWSAVNGGWFPLVGAKAIPGFNPCQGDYIDTDPAIGEWIQHT